MFVNTTCNLILPIWHMHFNERWLNCFEQIKYRSLRDLYKIS